ncbi:hypothetical protein DSM3645_02588 [Blastopirellula marina DSM 3645]|uniref:Uncharacterized protein n=1 Tax=Blastopirellula marina DSM 3645 TaxID=314230 RepID=A3ZVI1_9BACT|nr:hypothetical protein DSM3645_02588 [Blastopirellula marina DSM 3645]
MSGGYDTPSSDHSPDSSTVAH